MSQTKASQFHPKCWTAVTWLAVLLWAWHAFSLNYPLSFAEYENPEDAVAAAARLDQKGDWNASIDLYVDVSRK